MGKHSYLVREIASSKREEQLLLELIKESQQDCFVHGKTSLGEYFETLSHYEKKMSEAAERNINLETQRLNLFRFKSTKVRLQEERDTLIEKIKEVQTDYFKKGTMDTRIFESKTKSLMKRFSEVEKDIVLNEVKNSLRTQKGITAPFWRFYRKVVK